VTFTSLAGISLREPVKEITTLEDNIAFGSSVSGTFSVALTNDPYFVRSGSVSGRITDGRLNYFDGMAVSGDITESDQRAEIDLGRSIPVSRILVYWRSLACSTNFSVSVSSNARDWTVLRTGVNALKGAAMRGERGDPMLVNEISVEKTRLRYIRLLALRNAFYRKHAGWKNIQLMEIKVYP
jgi:hypothetical protein